MPNPPSRQPAGRRKEYAKHREKILAYHVDYYEKNRQTLIDKAAEWTEKNREKSRAIKARWQKAHPENNRIKRQRYRARKRGLPDTFSAVDFQRMLNYWAYACAVCGNQEGFDWRLAADHWIPLASPDCPGTVPNNMIPLCDGIGGCNTMKRHKDPHAWLVERLGARRAKKTEQAIAAYFAWVTSQC